MKSCLVAAAVTLASLASPSGWARAAGPASPALVARTLTGDTVDLEKLRGRVVLVHFWATWCPPCLAEMPVLESFYRRYRERGVQVIAMSQDRTRDVEEVKGMVSRLRLSYPVALARQATRNSFGEQRTLPVTFVIDAKGVVRAEMHPDTQPLTEESLTKVSEPLLAPLK